MQVSTVHARDGCMRETDSETAAETSTDVHSAAAAAAAASAEAAEHAATLGRHQQHECCCCRWDPAHPPVRVRLTSHVRREAHGVAVAAALYVTGVCSCL